MIDDIERDMSTKNLNVSLNIQGLSNMDNFINTEDFQLLNAPSGNLIGSTSALK